MMFMGTGNSKKSLFRDSSSTGFRGIQALAVLLVCISITTESRAQEIPRRAKTDLRTPVEVDTGSGLANASVRLAPPIQLAFKDEKHAFHLSGTSSGLISQVLGAYGLAALVADRTHERVIRFDTEEVGYTVAAELLGLATNTLFIPLDATHVLGVEDTSSHREDLQHRLTEVLYLPALSAAELQDVASIAINIFEMKQVSLQPALSTVTVRAAQSRLDALNDILADLLGGHSQILVDMRLLEVDSSRSMDAGLQLPQSSTIFNVDSEVMKAINDNPTAVSQIISSGLASAGDTATIAAILAAEGYITGVLTEPFAVFGGGLTQTGITFGTLTANLALSSSNAHLLDHVHLQIKENEPAVFKSGTRYPIEVASYTGSAYTTGASGAVTTTSSTTPQIQYEDLGFNLKVTPRTQGEGRIHLGIELKIQALSGQSINGIPVLTSQVLTTQASMKERSSTLLVSYLSRQRSRDLTGIPEFSQSATNQVGAEDISELAMIITPYLVRKRHDLALTPIMLLPVHE